MASTVSLYIVEDDLITRSQIKTYVGSVGYLVAGASANAETALKEIKDLQPDLAIVDIHLSGDKDGLWLASQLKGTSTPFIFLTAQKDKETIQDAVALQPNGYLIKPFVDMDLYAAIELAIKNFAGIQDVSIADGVEEIVIKDSIFIKDKHLLVKLRFEDLCYVKSDGNYLELHLADRKHLLRSKLVDFEQHLSPEHFIRTHQRYLVNFSKVDSIGTTHVLIEGTEIPVSQSYREALVSRINTL